MKYLGVAIILAMVISVPAFQARAKSGTQNPQRKKPSAEKSSPSSLPSEKEKPVKQVETRSQDATEAVGLTSPIFNEKLATSVALALSIGKQDVDDPIDKIRIMLESAKLLTGINPNDSRYIVAEAADLLLVRKKKEQSKDELTKIAAIESELVALYSRLDSEKTEKFINCSFRFFDPIDH